MSLTHPMRFQGGGSRTALFIYATLWNVPPLSLQIHSPPSPSCSVLPEADFNRLHHLGPIALWQRETPTGDQGICPFSPLPPGPRIGSGCFLSEGLQFLLLVPHLCLYAFLGFPWLPPPASSDLAAICVPVLLAWVPSPSLLGSRSSPALNLLPSLNLFSYPLYM